MLAAMIIVAILGGGLEAGYLPVSPQISCLEAEYELIHSNWRSRGHVSRRMRPYSAALAAFVARVFARCSEARRETIFPALTSVHSPNRSGTAAGRLTADCGSRARRRPAPSSPSSLSPAAAAASRLCSTAALSLPARGASPSPPPPPAQRHSMSRSPRRTPSCPRWRTGRCRRPTRRWGWSGRA